MRDKAHQAFLKLKLTKVVFISKFEGNNYTHVAGLTGV